MRAEKRCIECSVVKPLSEFHKSKFGADGTVNQCKECKREIMRRRWNTGFDYEGRPELSGIRLWGIEAFEAPCRLASRYK